jgi:hypothetical protein
MVYKIAAGILLLFGGIAFVCVGMVLAGYALYAALVPWVGIAGAAAIAAFIFLVFPIALCLMLARRGRRKWPDAFREGAATPENVALAYLAALAKDRPIVAVICAALVGVASAFLRKKK